MATLLAYPRFRKLLEKNLPNITLPKYAPAQYDQMNTEYSKILSILQSGVTERIFNRGTENILPTLFICQKEDMILVMELLANVIQELPVGKIQLREMYKLDFYRSKILALNKANVFVCDTSLKNDIIEAKIAYMEITKNMITTDLSSAKKKVKNYISIYPCMNFGDADSVYRIPYEVLKPYMSSSKKEMDEIKIMVGVQQLGYKSIYDLPEAFQVSLNIRIERPVSVLQLEGADLPMTLSGDITKKKLIIHPEYLLTADQVIEQRALMETNKLYDGEPLHGTYVWVDIEIEGNEYEKRSMKMLDPLYDGKLKVLLPYNSTTVEKSRINPKELLFEVLDVKSNNYGTNYYSVLTYVIVMDIQIKILSMTTSVRTFTITSSQVFKLSYQTPRTLGIIANKASGKDSLIPLLTERGYAVINSDDYGRVVEIMVAKRVQLTGNTRKNVIADATLNRAKAAEFEIAIKEYYDSPCADRDDNFESIFENMATECITWNTGVKTITASQARISTFIRQYTIMYGSIVRGFPIGLFYEHAIKYMSSESYTRNDTMKRRGWAIMGHISDEVNCVSAELTIEVQAPNDAALSIFMRDRRSDKPTEILLALFYASVNQTNTPVVSLGWLRHLLAFKA